MKRLTKRSLIALAVIVLIASVVIWQFQRRNGNHPSYRTAQVSRGNLLVTISATGTVEPEEVIDVGAQVAGQILSFGKDANGKIVDYGSSIEAGTVLAQIDDSLYAASVAEAEAQVQSNEANLKRAKADLQQFKAKLLQAERDWKRAQKLGPSAALSQANYDAYQSAYEAAEANTAVGEASVQQANATLAQAEAALRRAQRNLGYCTIKSPVKGVIIDRRVNIGQTVVSSLNAPSLFLIAKDLRRIQVWVAVNEADIGKIHSGMPVTFTVDAFPGELFHGEVGKIRLNASMTQNVVTYTVEIATDNSNGRLLPYLTANVAFELKRLDNALLVPNAALRFTPAADQIAPEFRGMLQKSGRQKETSATGQALETEQQSQTGKDQRRGILWVIENQYLRPVQVHRGISDGMMTAVEGGGVSEGLTVVTGMQSQENRQGNASNPFAPQFPGRRRNSSSR